MLWAMGALLTMFYLINIFNDTKSDIRQEYSNNYTDLLGFFRQTSSTIRDLQYLAERHHIANAEEHAESVFLHWRSLS